MSLDETSLNRKALDLVEHCNFGRERVSIRGGSENFD